MVITILQSCNLINLTIKLNFRHRVDDPPPLEWEPSSLPTGVLFSARVDETQGYLDLMHTTRPKCFNQDSNLIGNHSMSGIESLIQLGLLGEANFSAAMSLTAWE